MEVPTNVVIIKRSIMGLYEISSSRNARNLSEISCNRVCLKTALQDSTRQCNRCSHWSDAVLHHLGIILQKFQADIIRNQTMTVVF